VAKKPKLVSIRDKRKRKKFQREMIEGRWNRNRVDLELRSRFGRRKKGGRKHDIPSGTREALAQLDGICQSLEHWVAQVQTPRDREENAPKQVAFADLPPEVREQLKYVMEAVGTLRNSIKEGTSR